MLVLNRRRVRRIRRTGDVLTMERMAQIIKLKPEVIPEYKRIHAAVWPEILAAISRSNIRNYTIFLKEPENILFAYWEYHGTDFAADMEKIKKAPGMQEWWERAG